MNAPLRFDSRPQKQPAEAGADRGPPPVRPVVNAIRILRHLGTSGEPATTTELARTLGINPSTCFGILKTLVAEGMLVFDEIGKRYATGIGVVQLAECALSEDGKLDLLRPHLQRIADRFEVPLTLWSLSVPDRLVLVCLAQSGTLQVQMRVGKRVPALMGATGRLLAASRRFTKAQARSRFRSLRWGEAPSFEQYWAECELAARRGWAMDDGNFERGVVSVAVPLHSRAGSLSHAVVATMIQGRHDQGQIEAIAAEMLALERRLGRALRPADG